LLILSIASIEELESRVCAITKLKTESLGIAHCDINPSAEGQMVVFGKGKTPAVGAKELI
jgi:hypothetical protein